MGEDKKCFVIAPIGTPQSKQRKHSDHLLKYIIQPVASNHGFTVIRADQVNDPGLITSQIINLLLTSSLVIADLSFHNPNVFYELAIRHSTGKPVIQMIRDSEPIPFDVAGSRTIKFDLHDLDQVANAMKNLESSFKAACKPNKNPSILDNPFTLAIGIGGINTRIHEEVREDKKLVEDIKEIKTQLNQVSKYIQAGKEHDLVQEDPDAEAKSGKKKLIDKEMVNRAIDIALTVLKFY